MEKTRANLRRASGDGSHVTIKSGGEEEEDNQTLKSKSVTTGGRSVRTFKSVTTSNRSRAVKSGGSKSVASGDGTHVSSMLLTSTQNLMNRIRHPNSFLEHSDVDEVQCNTSYKFYKNKRLVEPLVGFLDKQQEISNLVFKPYYYIPDVVDPPYPTPKKEIFLKERPFAPEVLPKGRVIDDEYEKGSQVSEEQTFVCQLELINNLRAHPEIGFYYMKYAVERSSKYFHPYALKVVEYKDVDNLYMTLGPNGVTQYSPLEMVFTPTEYWEQEYKIFLKLRHIKTFETYLVWKPFYVWKKYVMIKKANKALLFLDKNLFACDPVKRQAMLEINGMCSFFLYTSLIDTMNNQKVPLFYFIEIQFGKLERIMERLHEFRGLTINILNNSCLSSLLKAGFTPDDSNITIEQTVLGKTGGRIRLPKDGILKMSFIEQARKRETCARLANFIHTIDYYQLFTLQNCLHNTYDEILEVLQTQIKTFPLVVPDFAEIQAQKEAKKKVEQKANPDEIDESAFRIPEEKEVPCPYIDVDLVINMDGIELDPSEKIIRKVLNSLQEEWENQLHEIQPLLHDPAFYSFTRPYIDGKYENPKCGRPATLKEAIDEDAIAASQRKRLLKILDMNFNSVKLLILKLQNISDFYREDMLFDEGEIQNNTKIDIFRQWCERYRLEEKEINSLPEYVPLGFFHIKLERFKKGALPAPNNKQEILAKILPEIGKNKVLALMDEAGKAVDFLAVDPVSTEDYVAYIKFVDSAQTKIESMEVQLDYVKELYDIIEEYGFPVEREDMGNYLGISVHFTSLRLSVDKCLEERVKLITKFNKRIHKDISQLVDKIQAIDEEVSQPWLLQPDSVVDSVMEVLNNLNERLTECINLSNDYRSHQKAFKVEMTRFEILEQVLSSVKLRILLWNSLTQFDSTVAQWYELEFNTLDVDEISNYVLRNVKNIQQLEKGLPPNDVLPLLKDKVEDLQKKLPVIGYLRNPNLRTRHWIKIEQILKHKFRQEDGIQNLQLFSRLGAFNFSDELSQIASAASSEAGLELMLAKVDDAWKVLDFQINKHKDQKDIFVLGSLEEVQATLDDSNITIQTVAASRYVAPVKPRVDDWLRRLELFSKCLDAWQYCQMQWLYLEAIFSAPDIQRQLPVEAKLFIAVDKSWKDIMRKAAKMPLALENCIAPGVYEQLLENNKNLDTILKCLEAYLETKCVAFPRFFFLSNDELLEILAQTRNPHAVQRHLQKCFDAIYRLEFDVSNVKGGTSNDILAMLSPEGERVDFAKGLKARGNVEDWLGKVEAAMFATLKKKMIDAIRDWSKSGRRFVIYNYPSQIVLTVSQIYWAQDVHKILDAEGVLENMAKFEKRSFEELNKLAAMVRGDLPKLIRDIIINIITVDVHARDTISILVENKVTSSDSFDWMKALRYYWDNEVDNCLAKMSNAVYTYGYEYLGAQRRLVITPLTDKCYLCLMGALQLDLGGAPAGPAGTGKTETTKDLAKALAIQCVVFNCSDGLDYKMMGRFFSGLATSGAWCCFDEFNRIDIEVLSVIAQQIITIRNAKAARATEFMFEGRMIRLVMSCAAFITMNPGYAGRTELPDNLKALFRPVSMMVPNYQLIAEVTLYSEGFESSKPLSVKMALMYKLCSEQLSQQDHYDFGMRAVKSVLVMAGALKRDNPDKKEDVVLLRALRDSNAPKFLADDAELFSGILGDLFPGIEISEMDYGVFQSTIIELMEEKLLQPEACTIRKIIELHETMVVRHGVMTVGPTGSGKTTVLFLLRDLYTRLAEKGVPGQYYKKVHLYQLNPKSITSGELYGEVNPATMEWHDGLLGRITRHAVADQTDDHQWIVCDGPVDAVWIENLNTVLDDNKMLCLANSERIKLTPYMHMVFEVEDLKQASPATVSRCGMVYLDPTELKWLPRVKTWIAVFTENLPKKDIISSVLLEMFEKYVEKGLKFFKKNCDHAMAQVDIAKADMMCALIESIILEPNAIDQSGDSSKVRTLAAQAFIFAYIWAIGGNGLDDSRDTFEMFVQDQFEDNQDVRLPPTGDLWGLFVNTKDRRMDVWTKLMPSFKYDPKVPFFEILVPTIDTVRMGFVMQKLIEVNKPVLFTGGTGVGKSVIAKMVLNTLEDTGEWNPIILNFSAQTSSGRVQEILEAKLEKKKKTVLGAPIGKRVCVFVDDVNMPKLETYGAQPPIELLRQVIDGGGFYDRDKLFFKKVVDVTMTAACAPPGGGRNPLTPRFMRHFAMLSIPASTEESLKAIFKTILRGFLKDFAQPVVDIGDRIVTATVELYNQIALDLLPTPEKSHYIFNLRDLSKCFQGIMQADSGIIREANHMLRLFYHECLRVFHDRLINVEDKSYFYRLLSGICSSTFSNEVLTLPEGDEIIEHPPLLLFGDFLIFGAAKEDRYYEEITDINVTKNVLQEYLEDYSTSTSKEMNIIFFMDAIEHLCRLARILRSERGNGLLVGVGGMGKQSLTKIASHINGYPCHQIEVSRGYDKSSWNEDLQKFFLKPGALAEDATFLFTDTQIVVEDFLEDINSTLNSGEVPNLYEAEELERAIIATRPAAKEAGISEANRDAIYQYFVGRVRNHLHLMLCMSPVGDAFRRRCRMFPSLVNCCTIDWYSKWPREALLSVAKRPISETITNDVEKVEALASICVAMHESVEDMTVTFWEEMRRKYYTTPSSYLDLLKLYISTWRKKSNQVGNLRDRIGNGLNKLQQTNEDVAVMKVNLIELAPKLKASSIQVAELMKIVAEQQIEIDKVRTVVAEDEAHAKAKMEETAILEVDARKDLQAALPALEEAQKALASLNKNDINEIKVFNKPPKLVQFVMEAVCLLLGQKTEWATAKSILADTKFLDRLITYPIDSISNKLLKKLQLYTMHPDFEPAKVAKQSKVCKSICIWVRAVDGYAKIFRIVEPKRRRMEEAAHDLAKLNEILREKQANLAAVEAQVKALQKKYDAAVDHLASLEYNMKLGETRLGRSGRLTSALADEEVRWVEMMKEFEVLVANIPGDTLIAAGGLAYLGAFTSVYRERLLATWLERCAEEGIQTMENFSLLNVLADPYEVRMWNSYGLPRDQVSTENAILVTQAGRWPLMIDPQEQANRWIRNMEAENGLKVVKMTDANFMRIMEACIRSGSPILVQEIGETLDPSLEPILLKQTFVQAGRTLIRLGDNDVEYDKNFKLYITTKMANPHYLPEICIKVTIINFTVTPTGLEDQLLADVVRLEKPELERMRNELIAQINSDKAQMKAIEDKILEMLFAPGNILDNEEIIETLNESKETSAIIGTRLMEAEATEVEISNAREAYRNIANRGSTLYFVVANLAQIDPMYQFSLKYFNQVIENVIQESEQTIDLEKRIAILFEEITYSVFKNVSRGLFERHKIVYSFMINIAILLNDNLISHSQWMFLLRGPDQMPEAKKPELATLTDGMWNGANYLAVHFPSFERLMDDYLKIIKIHIDYYEETINVLPANKQVAEYDWDGNLSDIEKLMLLRALKEEKVIFGVTAFVQKNLGEKYVESPIITLNELYADTTKITPLVFVLSTGTDPLSAFQKFAAEYGYSNNYTSISLGQGQGPIAEGLIRRALVSGDWVFLQNCHLATSWMLALENLVIEVAESAESVHQNYRLYLSSMPSTSFPVSVLQNSVKVTNEPPKGLKANVKRAFFDLEQPFFERNVLGDDWRRMIFGICFFHAIIQERKKFGPLGWNIVYEFSNSDRECCLLNLKMFCSNVIPWDALIYTTGEITYGGRITDNWDLRCLKTIFESFFSPKTLDPSYVYSPSGVYYAPSYKTLEEYREFIDGFPIIEDPEIFGMHENANIAFQLGESKGVLLTILEVQPKTSGGGTEGKSDDEIAYELADVIMSKIALKIDIDTCHPKHLKRDSAGRLQSLTVVLLHEVERYNILLKKIHSSMENLQKAIKGFVVMSEELENVYRSLVNNQVPQIWHKTNVYPSLKSLGSWIQDLVLRIDFIKIWLTDIKPISFWISGLSFPQGFITGVLQTHARKYNIPIDHLTLDFKVTDVFLEQADIEAAHRERGREVPTVYKGLKVPEDGVLIHGLFIDAGKWDSRLKILVDASKGEMNPPLPCIEVIPALSLPKNDTRYVAPLYKTSIRAGVLSTTGHSTNFVMPVLLPSARPQSYWILKGTALLIGITN